MRKCLPLNLLEPTRTKRRMLRKTYTTYLGIVREALCSLDGVKGRAQLHNKTYARLKAEHNIASQLVIEATSHAWSIRRNAGSKVVERCVVRFDRRLFSFKQTRRGNPVLTLRGESRRIGLPLSKDGAYRRLRTHISQGWRLTSIIMKKSMRLLADLSKSMPEPQVKSSWVGVDVNSPRIATSTIGLSGVLKQTYFGNEVSTKQFLFEKKRGSLQKYRDTSLRSKAGLKLRRLARRQRNYVRTGIWLVANQIVQQAEALRANIAVEKLRLLRKRRGEWNATSRRKVNRMPYGFLRHALRHVAERKGVLLAEVDPRYTSQMCPYCGRTGKTNWVGYAYFRCTACGYEANRDRAASLNIALRAAQTQDSSRAFISGQFPGGSASISRRVWQGEGFERSHQTTLSCKPTSFRGG